MRLAACSPPRGLQLPRVRDGWRKLCLRMWAGLVESDSVFQLVTLHMVRFASPDRSDSFADSCKTPDLD